MANMIPSDGAVDITTEHFKATRLEIVVMQVDNFQKEDEVSIPNEIILWWKTFFGLDDKTISSSSTPA